MCHSRTVLIVEDDESTREGLVELLGDMGFAVLAAENGQEALDLLRTNDVPCVILLDVMMPVMGGVEFRKRQLGEPAISAVPVIIVSAVDGTLASTLGAAAHLRKPFDVGKLIAAVEQHC